jgi:N,N'-diacetylchitobiose transport system permease protein
LRRLGKAMRLLVTAGLVAAWATPVLTAVAIWQWMFDFEFGVVNWLLTRLGVGDFVNHNWFDRPLEGFAVIVAVVVWGALPFVAITLHAGLTQVPQELLEAATVDGATGWQALRSITLPILKPLVVIVTTLSVIWNFGLFTQVWVVRDSKPEQDYQTLATYAFTQAFGRNNYSLGAAISVVTVLLMLGVMAFYIRQMFRIGDVD